MATRGCNQEPIREFRTFVAAMPHFVSGRDIQLNRLLQGTFNFGRPAVHFDERHLAIGSDNAQGPQVLLCVDTDVTRASMIGNPVVAQIDLPQQIQGTQWISKNKLLACVGGKEGPSNMRVYNIDLEGTHEFELKDDFKTENTVREVVGSVIEPNRIAYGGYDQALSILDLNHGPTPTSVFSAAGDVSSVRWSPYHNGRLVSCTTNEGQLRIYDVLGSSSEPAWTHQTDVRSHLNLYTHCQISEYQMLLGYEDNYIEAIDIRKSQSNFMTGTTDPYCYMVGDLHYRESSGLLLAAGMADFSVYKHYRSGPDKSACKLWCHSSASANRGANDNLSVTHAMFLTDNLVAATQEGALKLYKIE